MRSRGRSSERARLARCEHHELPPARRGERIGDVLLPLGEVPPPLRVHEHDRAGVEQLRRLAGRRLTTADELHIVSETNRTTEANRAAVLDRLRELVVQAKHEPKPRKKTKPSYGSKQRRLATKRRRSEVKAGRRGGGGGHGD